jgi:hypothetical protein
MKLEEQPSEEVIEKERKTVKRRVYDSINVLIALGKIKKDRKWLSVQQEDSKIGQEIVDAKKGTLEGMND